MDWKKIFMGSTDQSLQFFSPGSREGSILIQPPTTVFEDGASEWKLAFVGQFIGAAPSFGAMQKIVDLLWGKVSKVKVSLAGPNLYVFTFSSVDARDWVLENGPWHIQNKPLILRK
ncbi:hypothetical protein V6N13_058748 [Hibiscus sabdariffa]